MYKSILWVFFEKGFMTILQFLTLVILGRMLSVEDYGVYGTMIVFITVSDILVDSGFGGALIQKKEVTQKDINTLFFTNLSISSFLYVVLFAIAPLLEDLYKIDGLTTYFRFQGLVVILFALSVVQNSMLIRDMQFRKSATIVVISNIISSAIAILMAYKGFGVWALIGQTLSNSMITTIWLWLSSKYKITLRVSRDSFKSLWSFGSNLLMANILSTIANNINSNIIPKIGSVLQSGLYLQANKVSSVPSNIISLSVDKSIFPILSREKDNISILKKARGLNRMINFIFIPVFPMLSLCASSIISIVLGDKWVDATLFFQILSWGGLALILQSQYRNIIKATGNSRLILKVEILKTCIMLAIIFVAFSFGVLFLVIGMTISYYIGVFIWSYAVRKEIKYKYKDQVFDIIRPFSTAAVIYIVFSIIGIDYTKYASLVILPIYYLIYVLANLLARNEETFFLLKRVHNKIIMKK